MSDGDLIKLYSARILQLTTQIPHQGRLPAPSGTATRRSPTCGSTVTVDVVVQEGRVVGFAQQVKACALGQAAAAIVGAAVLGCNAIQIRRARDELAAMLGTDAPDPAPPFAEFAVLRAAQQYKNRHASILLAIEATLAAVTLA